MGILSRLKPNKKNKLVQPKIIVEEDHEIMATASYEDGRSYHSTWFADPESPTGRRYRVQVFGEMGTVESSGTNLAMAMQKANKEYNKKVK